MAGLITTASHPKALWPGVKQWWGQTYDEHQVEYTDLFDSETSTQNYEEDVQLTGFGLVQQKPEGSGVLYDSEVQGFTTRYTHVAYALGYIVTKEELDDNLYETVSRKRAAALAMSFRQTKENVAANVYNRAFNTSYVGGDGATLIASAGGGGSTSHPNVAGGTWTNGVATASDLSEAALEQAVIDIAGYRDDRGLLIAAKPQQLVIPYQQQFEAHRILGANGRVGTDLNDPNAIKDMSIFKDVTVNHYLTDADAWFIRTDVKDGMKYFERRADQFEMDNDFDTENAKFKATARYSFGWSDPRCIYGSPGA